MFVKPVSGRPVPDPAIGDLLPESGRQVEANQYWFRRLQDGDVTEGEAPKEPAAKPATASSGA